MVCFLCTRDRLNRAARDCCESPMDSEEVELETPNTGIDRMGI